MPLLQAGNAPSGWSPDASFLTVAPWGGYFLLNRSISSITPVGRAGRCSLASLDPTRPEDLDALVAELQRLLQGMRHGSVTVIVQDGRIVQLDATHKLRLAGETATRRPSQRR